MVIFKELLMGLPTPYHCRSISKKCRRLPIITDIYIFFNQDSKYAYLQLYKNHLITFNSDYNLVQATYNLKKAHILL